MDTNLTGSVVFIAPGTIHPKDDSSLLTIDENYKEYLTAGDTQLIRNTNNDIISEYKEGELPGVLVTVPIKTYLDGEVDTNIYELLPGKVQTGPKIVLHPHQYYRSTSVKTYVPGNEILVDSTNTVKILKGSKFQLNIGIEVSDLSTLEYEWRDDNDSTLGTGSSYEFDSNIFDSTIKSIYCLVSNKVGSDISDTINIEMIDNTNKYIERNLIKNGYAIEGTNDWESVGDNPEEVGAYSVKRFPAYVYHNFRTDNVNGIENTNVNQWYPTPESFEANNPKFKDKIVNRISENRYFKGGIMEPRDVLNNDTSGLYKTSYQDIDLTEIADLIDGKVYGISKLSTVLFGWIGTRGDQADECSVQFEFFDENGDYLFTFDDEGNKIGGSYIATPSGNITWVTRNGAINELNNIQNTIIYRGGKFGSFDYVGLENDLVNIFHPLSIKAYKELASPGSIVGSLSGGSFDPSNTLHTIILGRQSELRDIPAGTRTIRVTKTYQHISILRQVDGQDIPVTMWDLLYTNRNPTTFGGGQYTSEAMVTGLNMIAYINDEGVDDIKYIDMLKHHGYDLDILMNANVSENIEASNLSLLTPNPTPNPPTPNNNNTPNNPPSHGGAHGGSGGTIMHTQ